MESYWTKAAGLTIVALVLFLGMAVGLPSSIGGVQGSGAPQAIPDRVAGYDVLDVRTKDNTSCYSKDVPLFVLQTSDASQEDSLSRETFDIGGIRQALVDLGYPEDSEIMIAGPGISKEMAVQKRQKWNSLRETHGCIQFGGPRGAESVSESADGLPRPKAQSAANPGFSTVVDEEIGPNTNHNAQSVGLKAPTIGNNQSFFSAFLNNGYTNAPRGYLLQNGLLFDDGFGDVV